MRIIAGSLGGRRLVAPQGLGTRPTADRVKEAVFNILGPPEHAERGPFRVLDLYAGSGALGLEAISRGADEAVLVESQRAAIAAAERNVAALGVGERVHFLRAEVGDALGRLAGRFAWVFLDPPYGVGHLEQALRRLGEGQLLEPDAVVIAEHDAREAPDANFARLTLVDRRRYGHTAVSFYRLVTADQPEGENS